MIANELCLCVIGIRLGVGGNLEFNGEWEF
jgi:hypothetical protein